MYTSGFTSCQLLHMFFAFVLNYWFSLQDTAPSVINWQDYEGRTALHLAVADGNEAIVHALVRKHLSPLLL